MVQAWYDEGQARAAAERQARGPPDTAREEHLAQRNGFGGWGGRKYTKEEAEADARSSEAIRAIGPCWQGRLTTILSPRRRSKGSPARSL